MYHEFLYQPDLIRLDDSHLPELSVTGTKVSDRMRQIFISIGYD